MWVFLPSHRETASQQQDTAAAAWRWWRWWGEEEEEELEPVCTHQERVGGVLLGGRGDGGDGGDGGEGWPGPGVEPWSVPCRRRYSTSIPANLQSTEVGIASHKNREIEGKKNREKSVNYRQKSVYYRQKSGYLKQNNAKKSGIEKIGRKRC